MKKPDNRQNLQAYLAMLGGLSFMCFSAIFVKSSHAPGIVTAFYRMFIGSIILVILFIYFLKKSNQKLPIKGVILAISGGICFGCDMSLWSTAVVMSNATLPTLMANLAPIWVAIAAIIFFREKNNIFFWIGLALSVGGVALLVSNDIFNSNGILKGALLGLGAGFFYAVF